MVSINYQKKVMRKLYIQAQTVAMWEYYKKQLLLGDERFKESIFIEWIALYARRFREDIIFSLGYDPLVD